MNRTPTPTRESTGTMSRVDSDPDTTTTTKGRKGIGSATHDMQHARTTDPAAPTRPSATDPEQADAHTADTAGAHTDPTDTAQADSGAPDGPLDANSRDADATDSGADELGVLMWVDPASLIVGLNTRRELTLDAHFVASIRDRGVREPITVRRRDDGALVVRKGQRRTLAAVKVGLTRIRAVLEAQADPVADDTAQQIDRIVDQLGENHHRAAITERDEVTAHQELLDLGLSAAQIARRTQTTASRVRSTTGIARSELARQAMARYDLTLDQAAAIAGFQEEAGADDHSDETREVRSRR
ncbi:MAG: hypothetical protein ABS81_08165 [Pseudonocardia sp. SCN 72-86]|nr:MAG: hypothetical protein ABS81_08165 [Pseudonocardia sp. SCN 72-86]